MKVVTIQREDKVYYYLKHSIRKNGKVITKEKYLGTKIPENLNEIEANFYNEINKELFEKLDKIKNNFNKDWNKLPEIIKNKELEEISIAFTYNTNAIEGSTITLFETREIITNHKSPSKSIKEIYETKNHAKTFLDMLNKDETITIDLILKWHEMMFKETKPEIAGVFREYLVRVGNYLAPYPEDMKESIVELEKFIQKSKLHPIELCARSHYLFEKIHPFGDGNGRVGRLLLNYILWKNKYPMIIIEYKNRKSYYRALEKNENEFTDYFIKMYLKAHEKRYLN